MLKSCIWPHKWSSPFPGRRTNVFTYEPTIICLRCGKTKTLDADPIYADDPTRDKMRKDAGVANRYPAEKDPTIHPAVMEAVENGTINIPDALNMHWEIHDHKLVGRENNRRIEVPRHPKVRSTW